MLQQSSHKSTQEIFSSGNIINAGLQLYCWRFWLYFSITLRALLWLIIPLYGWAKFFINVAIISRIAFLDLINQPEDIADSHKKSNKKIWGCSVANLLNFIIIYFSPTIHPST